MKHSGSNWLALVVLAGMMCPVVSEAANSESSKHLLVLSKLDGSASLKNNGKDTLSLKGSVQIDTPFVLEGAVLSFSVCGVQKTFTLDSKGKASDGRSTLEVKLDTRDHLPEAILSFKLRLKDVDFENTSSVIVVNLTINGSFHSVTMAGSYNVKGSTEKFSAGT